MTPEIRAVCSELTLVRQAIEKLCIAAKATADAEIIALAARLEVEAASTHRAIQRRHSADVATSEEGQP